MAEYQQLNSAFKAAGVSVYALSTDNKEKARQLATAAKANFPVLYSVDGPALAKAWGGYYEERRNILHATGFVLHPDHKILSATYSTGPVGRLDAKDGLSVVHFYKDRAAKAAAEAAAR